MKYTIGELRERASRVLDICDLHDVRLVRSETDSAHPPLLGTFDVDTDIQFKAVDRSGEALDVFARYTVTANSSESPELEAWQVKLELAAVYRKSKNEAIDDEDAAAFAAIVAMMNIHPYAREMVQSSVQRLGYAPFTMDMLQSLGAMPDDQEVNLGD